MFIRYHAKGTSRSGLIGIMGLAGGHLSRCRNRRQCRELGLKDPIDTMSAGCNRRMLLSRPTSSITASQGEDALGRGVLENFKARSTSAE